MKILGSTRKPLNLHWKKKLLSIKMSKQYHAISLFSGAMGLDLGIEKAGFEIDVCVEMDKWAAETIRLNTRIPVINDDINKVSTQKILETAGLSKEDVTLVVGGPPCQAFSTAGRQRGLADFRGNVIIQYLRVVREIRPAYFILENVRGLLSAKLNVVPEEYEAEYGYIKNIKGSVIHFLTQEFKKLGYSISYALLNAANYGVPEKRERVIMIGHLGHRVPIPSPTHSEDASYGTKKWVTLRDAIGDLENRDDLHYIPLRPKSVEFMRMLHEGQNWRNLSPDIAERAMGKAYKLSGGKTGFLRRLNFDEPSPTLVTSPTMPATLLCHPTELRPLSIEEYARIQQFPDNWKFEGRIETVYKQIGNAVPVGLGYAAGHQVMRDIRGELKGNEEASNHIPYSRYKNSTDNELSMLFEARAKYGKEMNIEEEVRNYVDEHIHEFHEAKINKLKKMKLNYLLSRKNPYLYKAKNLNTPGDVVKSLAEAFMGSAEETLFGNWLENLAIFIAEKTYGGRKSASKGIDLEMEKDGTLYLVSIKSGPNWSNSSSLKTQCQDFTAAKRVYRTSGGRSNIEVVEGCCYGNEYKFNGEDLHVKICGQRFWEFISGDHDLYTKIIEPLGHNAKQHNDQYAEEYGKMITKFTKSFVDKYCDEEGNINWQAILKFNSGEKELSHNKKLNI